jgi:hypothetical protein
MPPRDDELAVEVDVVDLEEIEELEEKREVFFSCSLSLYL